MAAETSVHKAPPRPVQDQRDTTTAAVQAVRATAWALIGLAVASIWASVFVAGAYAPDFVSGSQHEHLKLVGGIDWIWGLVATAFVVLAAMQGIRSRVGALVPWVGLAVGVAAVWIFVALVSVLSPVWLTGTDPTVIPANALGVPILGVFLTWFACTFVKSSFEQYRA